MSKEITRFFGGTPAVIDPTSKAVAAPTQAVKQAMKELIVAFASAGEVADDRVTLVQVWTRKTAQFDPAVVAAAMDSLLTNNPRNPFRPSVQDIVERCQKVHNHWRYVVEKYFASGRDPTPFPSQVPERLREVFLRQVLKERAWLADGELRDCVPARPEGRGWYLATCLAAIEEWPPALLAEFGVLTGKAFERVNTEIEAEAEERERKWQEEQREREERDYKLVNGAF